MVGYFILVLVFLLFFSLSFYFGLREWFSPRDASPLPVDVEYVRVENYLGISFRNKMQEWLSKARALPGQESFGPLVQALLEAPSGEKILIVTSGLYGLGGRKECGELIYSEGDLRLPEPGSFRGEIYCRGKFESGTGVRLQAVAADGDLTLGEKNTVARWIDSKGRVLLRKGTTVQNRVISSASIELESQVSVQSLYAPLVFTTECLPLPNPNLGNGPLQTLTSTFPPQHTILRERPAYLGNACCTRLAADTWLVSDDLELPSGTHVESKLVIKGTLRSGADCHFAGDIKAAGIELGARNQASGNVVSGGEIKVGGGSLLHRNVIAEGDVLLCSGVRVGRPDTLAVVSSGREIRLEVNVAVCGKLVAGRAVVTL